GSAYMLSPFLQDGRYCLFRFRAFHHRVVFFLRTHDDVVPVAYARTGRYQVAADNVFLQVFQRVHLAVDGRFVQHLGGLLEGCRRHEAARLEGRTGDTLEYLARCGRYDVAHLDGFLVLALEDGVFVTQLAHGNYHARLYV